MTRRKKRDVKVVQGFKMKLKGNHECSQKVIKYRYCGKWDRKGRR